MKQDPAWGTPKHRGEINASGKALEDQVAAVTLLNGFKTFFHLRTKIIQIVRLEKNTAKPS